MVFSSASRRTDPRLTVILEVCGGAWVVGRLTSRTPWTSAGELQRTWRWCIVQWTMSFVLGSGMHRLGLIHFPSAMRWLWRQVLRVHQCLVVIIGLLPIRLAGCVPQITVVRKRFSHGGVLISLRRVATGTVSRSAAIKTDARLAVQPEHRALRRGSRRLAATRRP